MKAILPPWAKPLNIFSIHGTMCCVNMRVSYFSNVLVDNFMCYDARALYDANLVIFWGSFTKKLASLTLEEIQIMAPKRVFLHIRGCDKRIENNVSSSSLLNILPINRVFSNCIINPIDAKTLIREARQCLKA